MILVHIQHLTSQHKGTYQSLLPVLLPVATVLNSVHSCRQYIYVYIILYIYIYVYI